MNTLDLQVKDSQALYRSDFFPGLGWMTTQQVWQGLRWGYPHACMYVGFSQLSDIQAPVSIRNAVLQGQVA